jgi:vacuolar-type H+-ATPase catalytic subunit A/Vma1
LISQKSFETISYTLANMRFNEWTKELTQIVEDAFNEAIDEDKRLCYKIRQAIGDRFLQKMKQKGIQKEFERERKLRYANNT